jgi:transposase
MKSKWPAIALKLEVIEGLARDGWIEKNIASKLGVHVSTFERYKKEHRELCEALKRGKEDIDVKVENALLRRALGYETEEIRTCIEEDGSGKKRKRIEKIQRVVLPDVTAQIFWLKNRRRQQWNEKNM